MNEILKYSHVDIHRRELIVLKNINFTLHGGELVYLVGKVGSGKTSFMKSVYAEVPIASGEADVFGYDLNHLRRKDIPFLRRDIGIVFQDFQLLNDRSAYENLRFVLKATGWRDNADIEERIEQVLREVGMLNKGYKFPYELSGGEQQRVAIARAMLNSPRLLLADEPTGNLDAATGAQIIRRLHDIASKGTAVIVATHNMQWVNQFPARMVKCADKHFEEVELTTPETTD